MIRYLAQSDGSSTATNEESLSSSGSSGPSSPDNRGGEDDRDNIEVILAGQNKLSELRVVSWNIAGGCSTDELLECQIARVLNIEPRAQAIF